MIKKLVPFALLSAALVNLNACKSGDGEFKKLDSGLEYKIVKDAPGDKKPAIGDILEMHIKFKVDDSLLADSRADNNNQPVQIMLQPSPIKGDWTNGLPYLTEGDSAVFRMSVDSLKNSLQGQMLPPFMENKKTLTYEIVLVSVKSQQEFQEEQDKLAEAQNEIDDKLMQEYFQTNNLTPAKTSSGVYYIMLKEGSGKTAEPGQRVTVNYSGWTLDGNMFDSNTDPSKGHVEPFTFTLGRGEVIPGWDEGVALLKKGGKAKLFIPSSLAYGPMGRKPQIPENAILMFEVEVLKIEDGASDFR